MQYVYKLFDHELTSTECNTYIPVPATQDSNGEWIDQNMIDNGWSDDPQSPTANMPYCYCSTIKRTNNIWGTYSPLGLWSKWSFDGQNAVQITAFQWNNSPDTAPTPLPTNSTLGNWSAVAPNRPSTIGDHYLWMTQTTKHTAQDNTVTYDSWSPAIRISGDKGENGEDANDREYIYMRVTTLDGYGTLPSNISYGEVSPQGTAGNSSSNKQQNDWVPQGWSDTALSVTSTYKYVYMSIREYNSSTHQWGEFCNPVLWSNWGEKGLDGDGVQYVYKLFQNELDSSELESEKPNRNSAYFNNSTGEWEVSGWDDDPQSPTQNDPYCYCSVIKKTNGVWGNFGTLGLWSKWSEDGLRGDFKSRVFTRTNTDISATRPVGGTYDSPLPSPATQNGVTWSDGVPSGTGRIWSSVRTFKVDDNTTTWSLPQPESDTSDTDIEFSPSTAQPSAPTGSVPFSDRSNEGWYDPSNLPSGQQMIWRAERKVKNGAYEGSWVISRIYAEGGGSTGPQGA